MAGRERDRELLLAVVAGEPAVHDDDSEPTTPVNVGSPPTSARAQHLHHHPTGIEAFSRVIRSWAWKKFMSGCVILLPIAITFYTTWWFIRFVDGFFSPIYIHLGIDLFGLGFVTSITFIFLVGVFMSSWLGTSLLGLGEFFIKKMPLVRHIYSASKQISAAISPDQSSRAFKEVVIIRHPRIGEYALGFITSTVALRGAGGRGDQELACVYVPTNHLYLGDIFLMSRSDVIIPDLSVREAIEIVLSGGMSVPKIISAVDGVVGLGHHGRAVNGP
ncbi:protein LIKE COV 1-like [Phragmites australis]|uniref:protein LIKE COV 1-like n=1 Tax=Phragmites australis TaxID=29695 RepID=UPI002D778F6E|nr:protein LIKE COV 1-like [Phragmites australis]